MNSKTTWTYVAIAAAVFALIWFVEQPLRKKFNAPVSTKIFPAFDPKTATRIEVRPAGSAPLQVVRTNESWMLTSPLVYPADSARIESTLQAIAGLDWHTYIPPRELTDRPNAQEEFGFTPPTASLSITHGNSVLNLLIGTNTPVGEQLYLQVLGDVGVYVVNAEFLQFFPETAADWRDTSLFRITNEITSIRSRSGNKAFTLTRTNGSWRLPQSRADVEKVNSSLRKTLSAHVAEFETDNPQADLEKFGLQTPDMEVTFASGTNVLATMLIGKSTTNNPAQVFAKNQNQNHIFRVAQEAFAEWRNSYTNFVDRRLADFAPTNIVEIQVRGGDSFVLQRVNGDWKMVGNTNFSVDPTLPSEVLNTLSRAEVDIEKEVVTDFASFGLEPPALHYTLSSAGASSNTVAASIDFGLNQPGKVFVRRLDEYPDTVKSIHPEQFARLPRASWQFRDRQVWKFDAADVVSVTIQQKGKTRKLIRNAQNDWTFAPGSQGVINPFSFAEALNRLGDLHAVFWVEKGQSTGDRFRFSEADHRVLLEVKREDKTETLSLEFGGFSDFGTRYAAVIIDGERMVIEFPWPLFFEVQDSLTIPAK